MGGNITFFKEGKQTFVNSRLIRGCKGFRQIPNIPKLHVLSMMICYSSKILVVDSAQQNPFNELFKNTR